MEQWEIDIVLKAFLKYFGLRTALEQSVKDNDAILQITSIESLAMKTGLRKDFIKANLTEIINLK